MIDINWKASREDAVLISAIAKRAVEAVPYLDLLTVAMDLTATHLNGTPLRLQELLDAPDFEFWHDVGGIGKHIDRETGKLTNCFLPRCAR